MSIFQSNYEPVPEANLDDIYTDDEVTSEEERYEKVSNPNHHSGSVLKHKSETLFVIKKVAVRGDSVTHQDISDVIVKSLSLPPSVDAVVDMKHSVDGGVSLFFSNLKSCRKQIYELVAPWKRLCARTPTMTIFSKQKTTDYVTIELSYIDEKKGDSPKAKRTKMSEYLTTKSTKPRSRQTGQAAAFEIKSSTVDNIDRSVLFKKILELCQFPLGHRVEIVGSKLRFGDAESVWFNNLESANMSVGEALNVWKKLVSSGLHCIDLGHGNSVTLSFSIHQVCKGDIVEEELPPKYNEVIRCVLKMSDRTKKVFLSIYCDDIGQLCTIKFWPHHDEQGSVYEYEVDGINEMEKKHVEDMYKAFLLCNTISMPCDVPVKDVDSNFKAFYDESLSAYVLESSNATSYYEIRAARTHLVDLLSRSATANANVVSFGDKYRDESYIDLCESVVKKIMDDSSVLVRSSDHWVLKTSDVTKIKQASASLKGILSRELITYEMNIAVEQIPVINSAIKSLELEVRLINNGIIGFSEETVLYVKSVVENARDASQINMIKLANFNKAKLIRLDGNKALVIAPSMTELEKIQKAVFIPPTRMVNSAWPHDLISLLIPIAETECCNITVENDRCKLVNDSGKFYEMLSSPVYSLTATLNKNHATFVADHWVSRDHDMLNLPEKFERVVCSYLDGELTVSGWSIDDVHASLKLLQLYLAKNAVDQVIFDVQSFNRTRQGTVHSGSFQEFLRWLTTIACPSFVSVSKNEFVVISGKGSDVVEAVELVSKFATSFTSSTLIVSKGHEFSEADVSMYIKSFLANNNDVVVHFDSVRKNSLIFNFVICGPAAAVTKVQTRLNSEIRDLVTINKQYSACPASWKESNVVNGCVVRFSGSNNITIAGKKVLVDQLLQKLEIL